MRFLRTWLLGISLGLLLCGAGCKKSSSTSATTFTLPGASEVTGALDKKDYAAAIQALGKVKASVTLEQRPEYGRLLDRVQEVLLERMHTDESAAKAYQVLRIMESGR